MSHDTYDRFADWLEAHRWADKGAIYLASFSAVYGLTFGILVAREFFALWLLIPVAALLLRVQWHGFLRRLDDEYPRAPREVDCSLANPRQAEDEWSR